ncbi:MAG: metallophosphoesterase family protein [Alphaproteobacteria bacterium]|nr:metallophosphoesterase family protein [Alphaproteobacteria bacterium]MDD9920253.1 metallophosphoesterase family protein [Alphaproteobacteria bacterium]
MTKTPTRYYAVGDIHGRADLLTLLHKTITLDAKEHDGEVKIVYLGDYIDRGPQSCEVLDILVGKSPIENAERIFLMGNHECDLIQFLEAPKTQEDWLHKWGGASTLQSYSVPYTPARDTQAMANQLLEVMPEKHAEFLDSLALYFQAGNFLFVHGGVRPNIPLEQQEEEDLLYIKKDFTDNPQHGLPYKIIYGHTIHDSPVHTEDRIGVDTGAYLGGPLTAAVLEGDTVRFLQARMN